MPNETMINKRANGINWNTTVFMVLFHFGAVAALFLFSWRGVAAAIVLWWVAGSLGVGIGFHRLLTHRGYKTPKLVEYFLTVCGTLALEGGAINWVVTHRIHHAHADAPGDPHTPRDGRWWSHMGWILRGTAQQYDGATVARYAPDMLKDAFLMWGIFLRVTFNLHATWLVNSATHMWGRRRFLTHDDSRNNWWVALLTFGEGWHNNHHAHPTSARHGLAWYEIDFNWWGIRVMQFLRLAKGIKLVGLAKRAEACS